MNAARLPLQDGAPLTPAAIGRAATLALHDELALSPKPGLVTLVDNGSHHDMDAHTFMRSLFALRGYFVRIAEAGHAGAAFADLERCGIAAEARMLAATRGINTHRGAIFMLGLLCAAAGAGSRDGDAMAPSTRQDCATHCAATGVPRSPHAASARRLCPAASRRVDWVCAAHRRRRHWPFRCCSKRQCRHWPRGLRAACRPGWRGSTPCSM